MTGKNSWKISRVAGRAALALLLLLLLPLLSCRSALGANETVLINKWYHELTPRGDLSLIIPVKQACLADPFLRTTAETLFAGKETLAEKILALEGFNRSSLSHLQACPEFAENPSRMPWGRDGLRQIYKRLLPSEMKAMSIYTGKISGACESLSYFNAALLTLAGVPSEEILSFRVKRGVTIAPNHTITIVRTNDAYYYLDNTSFFRFTGENKVYIESLLKTDYHGGFGDSFYLGDRFNLPSDFFEGSVPLARRIPGMVFPDMGDPAMAVKIAYAGQLRDVPSPGLYLEASCEGPLVRALAKELITEEGVRRWIGENIGNASLFPGEESRVQTADQTLVYRTGSEQDRALLAAAIGQINGW